MKYFKKFFVILNHLKYFLKLTKRNVKLLGLGLSFFFTVRVAKEIKRTKQVTSTAQFYRPSFTLCFKVNVKVKQHRTINLKYLVKLFGIG